MVLWGVIWGAVIGWLFDSYWWEPLGVFAGALIGALAGWTLRNSVRSEFARLQKKVQQAATPTKQQARAMARDAGTSVSSAAATDYVDEPFEAFDQRDPYDAHDPLATASASASAPVPVSAATVRFESEPVNPAQWQESLSAYQASEAAILPSKRQAAAARKPDAAMPTALERCSAAVRNWFTSGNVVARAGALMLFVGLAFLAKWAADNSMFPPEARLAAIALVGIGLLVQGARMSAAKPGKAAQQQEPTAGSANARFDYGVLLQGLGVAVLYLAIFSAFKLYALLPASWAFVLMVSVCVLSSAIAVLRSAQVLAFVGFAGAFATPVLLSDGTGSHVSLFSYYLLLNLAILGLAFVRPWRAVNVLGFVATFGVASLWGVLRYQASYYATSQAFLLAFFVIYLLIGLLYALRHGAERKHKVDASLVFGLPIVVLGLQVNLVDFSEYGAALSAVLGGALYIALAWLLRQRASVAGRWLVQSYAAIGLLLVTVAVPLALEQQITAAVWALEGAAVYWLSRQQGHKWGCVLGVVLQAVAGVLMVDALDGRYYAMLYAPEPVARLPFANADFLSCLFMVVGAWSISWWSRHDPWQRSAEPHLVALLQHLSAIVSVVLFVVGFAWAWQGLWAQLQPGSWQAWHSEVLLALRVLVFIALVAAAQWAAQRYDWRGARLAAYAMFPVVAWHVLVAVLEVHWGWAELALWAVIAVVYLAVLQRADRSGPLPYWRVVHTANVVLGFLLLGRSLASLADWAQLWQSDWSAVAGTFSAIVVLLLLSRAAWWAGTPQRWPLNRFRPDYLLHAGAGVALLVGLCTLATACLVRGKVAPLPYVPLLNPVDLTVLLGVAAIALWRLRIAHASWVAAASMWKRRSSWLAIAALGFVVLNTIWLRLAHHYFGVRWQVDVLADSFVVQAGYSVLWSVLALLAMLWARRLGQRLLWQAGAGLLAVTVLKMLLVDMANSGGGERIVAFIAVGALMVAIGYFAPMPAARKAAAADDSVTP